MIFAKKQKTKTKTKNKNKNAFLKLENIPNWDTYFHPLYKKHCFETDDKCKAKACGNFKMD